VEVIKHYGNEVFRMFTVYDWYPKMTAQLTTVATVPLAPTALTLQHDALTSALSVPRPHSRSCAVVKFNDSIPSKPDFL
jgi:hypothetical protein